MNKITKVRQKEGKIIIGEMVINPKYFPKSDRIKCEIYKNEKWIEGEIEIYADIYSVSGPHNDVYMSKYIVTTFIPNDKSIKPFGSKRKEVRNIVNEIKKR